MPFLAKITPRDGSGNTLNLAPIRLPLPYARPGENKPEKAMPYHRLCLVLGSYCPTGPVHPEPTDFRCHLLYPTAPRQDKQNVTASADHTQRSAREPSWNK